MEAFTADAANGDPELEEIDEADVDLAAPSAATQAFAKSLAERCRTELDEYEDQFETKVPLKERIGTYWDFLNRPELDGSDNVAWSAAFISYMVHLAGGRKAFLQLSTRTVLLPDDQ